MRAYDRIIGKYVALVKPSSLLFYIWWDSKFGQQWMSREKLMDAYPGTNTKRAIQRYIHILLDTGMIRVRGKSNQRQYQITRRNEWN